MSLRPAVGAFSILAKPFAGIPLALRDAVFRPLFVFFLLVGSGAGLWLNFTAVWLAEDLGATPAQVGWFYATSFLAAASRADAKGRTVHGADRVGTSGAAGGRSLV